MDSFVFGRFLENPQSHFEENFFWLFNLHNSASLAENTIRFF